MKILVAEDEPLILMAVQRHLTNEGHDVIVTTDGREALLALQHHNINLIITDILMPFTSGLELIGIVKSDPKKNIPVLVLSGLGQESTVMEAFKLGADDFLTKPFNPSELSMRVKRLLKLYPQKI